MLLNICTSRSPYELTVWRMLRDIPLGETTSYGTLAARLGTRDAREVTEHRRQSGGSPRAVPSRDQEGRIRVRLSLGRLFVHVEPSPRPRHSMQHERVFVGQRRRCRPLIAAVRFGRSNLCEHHP